MFARLAAKALLLAAAAALVFFGVGLLGVALASALTAFLGAAGAYAVAGAVMLLLALVIVGLMALMRPRRPPPPPPGAFLTMLLGALAKDLPWAAVLSAGLAGVTELVLKRGRNKPKP
jgi:predicted Co/Zn/Cd cation transporter (cation efflux family)